jgi:hypothetical protein
MFNNHAINMINIINLGIFELIKNIFHLFTDINIFII